MVYKMADARTVRANKREIIPNKEEANICAEHELIKVSTTLLPDNDIEIDLTGTSEEHLLRHLDRKFVDLKSQIINDLRAIFPQTREPHENNSSDLYHIITVS